MGLLNVNEKRLKRKLRRTEKAHARYVRDLDGLKDAYYEIYDHKTVELLIEVVGEKGHPGEKAFATEFHIRYESENIDDIDIRKFKKFMSIYRDVFLEKRNKKGE